MQSSSFRKIRSRGELHPAGARLPCQVTAFIPAPFLDPPPLNRECR